MHDGLGVGMRAQRVAARFDNLGQFFVVVDFAVEGDPDGAVFVGEGLVAGRLPVQTCNE